MLCKHKQIDFMSNTRTQRLKERIASAAGLKWLVEVCKKMGIVLKNNGKMAGLVLKMNSKSAPRVVNSAFRNSTSR